MNVVDNVEERIVRLKFDSSKFDKNTKKARKKLQELEEQFDDLGESATQAGDGIEGMYEKTSKSKGYNVVSASISALGKKFSALEVMAVTALVRITNKAIDTGKAITKSLSIDNISLGYESYEQNLNTIRGLMNVTGQTEEWLAEKTARIAWFNDETSYSYEVLAAGIKNFMANGIADVDKATDMIEGIALASAKAGAPMTEFSHAVDILSRAYTQGYVDLQKWQSLIGSAGFATEEFKQQCIDAAKAAGTIDLTGKAKGVSEEITTKNIANYLTKEYGQNGIINKDAIEILLMQYASYANDVYDQIQNGVGISSVDEAEKVLSKNTKIMAEAYVSLVGKNADDFSGVVLPKAEDLSLSMRESLMEAALSLKKYATSEEGVIKRVTKDGRTLEYNVENIGNLMSEDTDAAMILQEALKNNSRMQELFNAATEKAKETGEDFNTVLLDMAEDFQSVYEKAFRSGQEARTFADALNSAKNASKQGWSSTFNTIFGGLEGSVDFFTALANKMIDIALVSQETRDQLVNDWAANGGRDALFGTSEENLGGVLALLDAIQQRLELMRDAFFEVFVGIDGKNLAEISKNFQSWAQGLKMDNEEMDKFKRTLKGLLLPIKWIAKALQSVWDIVVVPTLEFLSEQFLNVGDAIGGSGEAIDAVIQPFTVFENILQSIMDIARSLVGVLDQVFKSLTGGKSLGEAILWVGQQVAGLLSIVAAAFDGTALGTVPTDAETTPVGRLFQSLADLGSSIIQVLKNLVPVMSAIVDELGKVFQYVVGMLELDTESVQNPEDTLLYKFFKMIEKVFEALMPLINWLIDMGGKLIDNITKLFDKFDVDTLLDVLKMILPVILLVGLIKFLFRGREILEVVSNITDMAWQFSRYLRTKGTVELLKALALDLIAIATGLTAIMYAVKSLKDVPVENLVAGIAIMSIFIAAMIIMTVMYSKMQNTMGAFNLTLKKGDGLAIKNKKSAASLVKIGFSILALGAAFALFGLGMKLATSNIQKDAFGETIVTWIGVIAAMGMFLVAFGQFTKIVQNTKYFKSEAMLKLGKSFMYLGLAILPLALSMKIIGSMDPKAAAASFGAVVILLGVMAGVGAAVSKIKQGDFDKLGKMFLKLGIALIPISIAMAIMNAITKDDPWAAAKGIGYIATIMGIFVALCWSVNKVTDKDLGKMTKLFLSLGTTFGIIGLVMRHLSKMSFGELVVAIISMAVIMGVMVGMLVAADKVDMKNIYQLGFVILAFSALVATFALIGKIENYNWAVLGAALAGMGACIVSLIILMSVMDKANVKGDKMKNIYQLMFVIIALAGVAVAFALIGTIENINWKNIALCVGAMVLVILATSKLIKATEDANFKKMLNVGLVLIAIAGIVALIFVISKSSDQINQETFWTLIGAISVLAIAAGIFAKLGKDFDMKSFGKFVLAVGFITVIAVGLAYLSSIIPTNLQNTIVFILMMATLLKAVGKMFNQLREVSNFKFKTLGKLAIMFGILGTTFAVMIGSLALIQHGDPAAMATAMTLWIGVMVATFAMIHFMSDELKKIDDKVLIKFGVIAAGLSVVLMFFAAALTIMNGIDIGKSITGVLLFGAAMAGIMLLIKYFNKTAEDTDNNTLIKMAAIFGALAVLLLAFGAAMIIFNLIDIGKSAVGVGLFIVTIAAMTVMFGLLKKLTKDMSAHDMITIGILMTGFIAALAMFAAALLILNGIDMGKSAVGVGLFAAFLGVFVGLAALAGKFEVIQKGMGLISVAVVALGSAMLLAGAGMLLFSMGLERIAAIGNDPEALQGMITGVKAFIALLPQMATAFITGIVLGLIDGLKALADALPGLLASLASILPKYIGEFVANLLATLTNLLPAFYTFVEEAVKGLLQLIENLITPILHTLEVVINALLDWLMDYVPVLAAKIIELLLKLIDWLLEYISQPEFIQAVKKLVVKLIQTVLKLIGNIFKELNPISMLISLFKGEDVDLGDVGKELGRSTMAGYEQGLTSYDKTKMLDAFNEVKDGAQGILGIHSPSRVFRQFGEYCMEGFANGITADIDKPVSAFQKAIDMSKDLVNDINDDPPTIRPVLDLSDIQNGMRELNGILPDQSAYSVDGSIGYTAQTASDMRPRATKSTETQTPADPSTFNNVFNINGAQDPQAVAQEVSNIINKQVERRGAYRGRITVKQ